MRWSSCLKKCKKEEFRLSVLISRNLIFYHTNSFSILCYIFSLFSSSCVYISLLNKNLLMSTHLSILCPFSSISSIQHLHSLLIHSFSLNCMIDSLIDTRYFHLNYHDFLANKWIRSIWFYKWTFFTSLCVVYVLLNKSTIFLWYLQFLCKCSGSFIFS